MAQHEHTDEDVARPETWQGMHASLDGFPFPELTRCREEYERRPGVGERQWEGLSLLDLPELGVKFNVHRKLQKSLMGCVFHGTKRLPPSQTEPGSPAPLVETRAMPVAIKTSSLEGARNSRDENIFREIAIMRHLFTEAGGHPGKDRVMPLMYACISERRLHVITPLCEAGDLLKHVHGGYGMEERTVRKWFKQILLGLAYIHSRGICHHDLSPENIVITGNYEVAVVMDFGMAQRLRTGPEGDFVPVQDERVFGKFRYMAPEIFRNRAYDGRQADIWSVAVMLVLCFTGRYAWGAPTSLIHHGDTPSDMLNYMHFRRYGPMWILQRLCGGRQLSEEAESLVRMMLVIDCRRRPCSAEALACHVFFRFRRVR